MSLNMGKLNEQKDECRLCTRSSQDVKKESTHYCHLMIGKTIAKPEDTAAIVQTYTELERNHFEKLFYKVASETLGAKVSLKINKFSRMKHFGSVLKWKKR